MQVGSQTKCYNNILRALKQYPEWWLSIASLVPTARSPRIWSGNSGFIYLADQIRRQIAICLIGLLCAEGVILTSFALEISTGCVGIGRDNDLAYLGMRQ